MDYNDAQEKVEEALTFLSNYFDHFQILATWDQEQETHAIQRGRGNWYARQGMAQEFINMDRAQEQAFQIAARLNPDDDE